MQNPLPLITRVWTQVNMVNHQRKRDPEFVWLESRRQARGMEGSEGGGVLILK